MNELLKTIVGEDSYWQQIISEYISQTFNDKELYAINLLKELSKDKEIFNCFTKSLVQKTYNLKEMDMRTLLKLQQLAEKNPTYSFLEIYYVYYLKQHQKPIIYIEEFDVKPESSNKDIFEFYNNVFIENKNIKISETIGTILKNVLLKHKDAILNCNDVIQDSYKGGKQKILIINDNAISELPIEILGNTSNEKIAGLYNELKDSLLNSLKDI